MVDYLYDATFSGFLCCVYAHYYEEKAANIFPAKTYQASILARAVEIETDEQKALIVYRAIEGKISSAAIQRVYRMFLADDEKKERTMLNYVRLGFIKGSMISVHHGHPIVREAELIEKKVTREAHRINGLLRFSALKNGVLYAEIEPDNDILELIAPHFSDRYKNDPFIVHDLKRKKALIAAGGEWYISEFQSKDMLQYESGELEYRRLWKNYFDHIAIKERTNPRCQRAFMPKRYWKHLTEKR